LQIIIFHIWKKFLPHSHQCYWIHGRYVHDTPYIASNCSIIGTKSLSLYSNFTQPWWWRQQGPLKLW
jgi:hypothetical protein